MTTMIDVAEKLTCPECGTRGEIELRGERRCYGVGVLLMRSEDGAAYLSPDGWNEGDPNFDEVWCQACENELDENDLLKQLEEAQAP